MSVSWTWVWAEPQTQARTCAEDSRREELSGRWSLCFKDQGNLEPPLSPVRSLTQKWSQHQQHPDKEERNSSDTGASDQSLPDAGHLQVLGPPRSQNSTCRAVCASVEASLAAQMVKKLPAMQGTQVQSLGREDPWRRKWIRTILAWRIPWTEEPGGLQSKACRVQHPKGLTLVNMCHWLLQSFWVR